MNFIRILTLNHKTKTLQNNYSVLLTWLCFVWSCKMVSVNVSYLFYQPMDEKIKTWTLRFPAKENPNMERHCSIGQSCFSMTSKWSINWFLESSRAWRFFTRVFAEPTKSHAHLYPFDIPIKSLYFRSFVVSVLFACLHFKVIRKSKRQS